MPSINWDEPISNDRLFKAIQGLELVLGRNCTEDLIAEMQTRGIEFDYKTPYSFAKVSRVLKSIFGPEGSAPIIYFVAKQISADLT